MSVQLVPLIDPEHDRYGRRLAWLASGAGGRPVGSAFLRLFSRAEQRHRAELEVHVHPAERRAGTGTLLLDAAAGAARDDGCRSLLAEAEVGSPGDSFLAARGFRAVLTLVFARLAVGAVDRAALASVVERPHPGYRLVWWDGTVPDELAGTFARSRRAMDDMPVGDTDYGTVVWDEERVRAAAKAVADRGDLLHTVAVVAGTDGPIVGFTELVVPGDGTGDAQHYGTGVLPEHRGHGLGRWMKAASIVDARARHPQLDGLLTDTADTNRPMLAINDSLGYAPTHRTARYRLDLGG